jgi:Rap1a immunity proteins
MRSLIATRSLIAALLGALACLIGGAGLLFAQDNAPPTTPSRLLKSCQEVVNSADATSRKTIVIPGSGLRCWYYMSAVQDMSVLVDQEGGQRLLRICAPPDTTLMDYVRIFVHYARDQRGKQRNPAALAVTALNNAFPCPKERTVSAIK